MLTQVLFDGVEVELAQLIKHDACGLEARHLAAQLTADAAAGTGDQHRLAGQHLGNAGFVQLHRLTAQQVFGFDVAHPLDGGLAVSQLIGRWHGEHRQAAGCGQVQRMPAL